MTSQKHFLYISDEMLRQKPVVRPRYLIGHFRSLLDLGRMKRSVLLRHVRDVSPIRNVLVNLSE